MNKILRNIIDWAFNIKEPATNILNSLYILLFTFLIRIFIIFLNDSKVNKTTFEILMIMGLISIIVFLVGEIYTKRLEGIFVAINSLLLLAMVTGIDLFFTLWSCIMIICLIVYLFLRGKNVRVSADSRSRV